MRTSFPHVHARNATQAPNPLAFESFACNIVNQVRQAKSKIIASPRLSVFKGSAAPTLGQQTKAPTQRILARERPSHQPPNSLASGSIVCNFVDEFRRAKYSPKICSAKQATFGQQTIFSASLQDPWAWAGDDSANFQPVPVNHYDPRSWASSRRPPRFSASQSQLWPASPPKRPARLPSKILGLPSAHSWQCSASRIPSASFQDPWKLS